MKVLMLGWELPPHNSGGLGVACFQLCKELAKGGVNIKFILPYSAKHDIRFMNIESAHPQGVTEIVKSGIAYDSYKYIFDDGREEWVDIYRQQAMYETEVSKIVQKDTFDVIHAHDWLTFRAGLRAKQMSGKPLIVHAHSIESDRAGRAGGGNPLVREIESLAFLMADEIIAVSHLTKRSIAREYNIPLSKIDVVHNSLEQEEEKIIDKDNVYKYLEFMKSKGYKVIVNIGRLTIQKGLTNFLYAAKAVIDKEPKTIFLIVGSGEQYHELVELSCELGIAKNVVFTGFQRGKRWRDSYQIADLFVMPSVSEPFGLTPLEAAGYGIPSLISHQSGVAEVFNNCLKIDFWDINGMADKIIGVVRSAGLREELSKNSHNEYTKLSWKKAATKMLDHYNGSYRLARVLK